MRTLVAIMITLALATAAAPTAAAAAPEGKEDKDKVVLQNDFVSVWFQGKKPMLKVFPADLAAQVETGALDVTLAAGLGERVFDYRFTDLVEYRDLDGDGLPSNNEVVASLALDRANGWVVDIVEEEARVVLNLTLEAPVKLGKALPVEDVAPDATTLPDQTAKVGLVFTIHSAATTLDADGVALDIPATSIKYDLLVERWPFVNAELHRLALDTSVTGELEETNVTGAEGANVVANGTNVGALTWITSAVGNTTAGDEVDVPVRVATEAAAEGRTRLVYTYDAPQLASLVHDPTIGTTPTAESMQAAGEAESAPLRDVPAPGLLVAAAAVGLSALVARRRR